MIVPNFYAKRCSDCWLEALFGKLGGAELCVARVDENARDQVTGGVFCSHWVAL